MNELLSFVDNKISKKEDQLLAEISSTNCIVNKTEELLVKELLAKEETMTYSWYKLELLQEMLTVTLKRIDRKSSNLKFEKDWFLQKMEKLQWLSQHCFSTKKPDI